MASLPKGAPQVDKNTGPPDQPTQLDREATALLTPPPLSNSPAGADAPTKGAYTPGAGTSSSDAPTMIDAPRPSAPIRMSSHKENMLPPGTVLGQRYEILALLGEGGMGAVYKAMDREVDHLVALKVIRPDLARDKDIIDRFKQELLLARKVTHRNVIRIYELQEADGVKFITMEHVEGEDLRALLLRNEKLALDQAVDVVQQVCRALDAAHTQGIIHRDLKPQNVMLDKTGRVLVMDFGLARTVGGGGMTQTGALIGTMDYMSPEQALAQNLDQRSDIYTVGLILYELLTGKMPFASDSALASLIKRTQERVAPISDKSLPSSITHIVSKCLERDPNLRYQSVRELITDLERCGGNTAAASLRFPSLEVWAQGTWRWIGIAIVVVALAAAGIVLRRKISWGAREQQTAIATPDVSLAILPFRNASGDRSLDWIGSTLSDMLTTEVGQSGRVRSVSPERLHQLFADLRITPDGVMDSNTLARIAGFTNADTVVYGQFARFGEQIRIDFTLRDLKNARSTALKVEAANENAIPHAVDGMAETIRNSLAVPANVVAELRSQAFKPTTASVAALRDYTAGLDLSRIGNELAALEKFEAATSADPKFALAFSRLGESYLALGHDAEAVKASRRAVDLSDQLSRPEQYLIRASYARLTKDNKNATDAYENLEKIFPEDSDIQYALGTLCLENGNYAEARTHFSRILQTEPKNIRALWQLGVVEIDSNNPQAALDPLGRGLTLAIELDNKEQKALILQAMGISYRLLNKPAEALQNYQQALALNREIGQQRGVAASLNEIAQVNAALGHSDTATAQFNEALKIRRTIGAKKEIGDTLIDLGNLYDDRGEHARALAMYKESLQIQRDAGDRRYEALCLNNMGDVYFAQTEYDNALVYYQQALRLREELNAPSDIADTVHNIGDSYVKTGRYDEGLSSYLRALDLRRSLNDKHGAALESSSLGMLFILKGRYGAALDAEQQATQTFYDLRERSLLQAQTLLHYAEALASVNRDTEAEKPIEEAMAIARDLKNVGLQAQVLSLNGDRALYRLDYRGAERFYAEAKQAGSGSGEREPVLMANMSLAKVRLLQSPSQSSLASLQSFNREADKLGMKYLYLDCTLAEGEALLRMHLYREAQTSIETVLNEADHLGLVMLSAKAQYLLGKSLRLAGKPAEAMPHYRQAAKLLKEMSGEPATKGLLARPDVKAILDETSQSLATASS